jgi:multimeric flavodoxin WrbA
MKSIILSGSKNLNGHTAQTIESFISGLDNENFLTEKIFLPHSNLNSCKQCNEDGWGECRKNGYCIQTDDFSSILDKIYNADLVVFATPVYFSDISESMKTFLDRLRRILIYKRNCEKLNNKAAAGICVAGGRGGGSLSSALILENILLKCGFNVLDMITVKKQNLIEKLPIIKATAAWITKKI